MRNDDFVVVDGHDVHGPQSDQLDLAVGVANLDPVAGLVGSFDDRHHAGYQAAGVAGQRVQQARQIAEIYGADGYTGLIEEARELNPDSETLARAEALQEKGKTISPAIAKKLIAENTAAIEALENR